MMRIIALAEKRYSMENAAMPAAGPGEVLIHTAFAGINRADLLQKQGKYPLPSSRPAVAGMEVSGTVAAFGEGVTGFKPGDKVCALLREGAFAEAVVVNALHVLPVPGGITLEQACALPEACFTVWISLVWQARLAAGESVLIHGATSGIGTMAVQIAKLLGARIFTTSGSHEKCALAEALGAERAIHYRTEDFTAVIKEMTRDRGVDVILDMVGGGYFERNLNALAHGGRLAMIAFLNGAKVEANLAPLLLKHLSITGSTLRMRPDGEKARIAAELKEKVWPALAKGMIKPVIDKIFPFEEAEKALDRMDQGLNIGKILLKI